MSFNIIAGEYNGKGGDEVLVFVVTSSHHYTPSSKNWRVLPLLF
jgi:hypothetical protein